MTKTKIELDLTKKEIRVLQGVLKATSYELEEYKDQDSNTNKEAKIIGEILNQIKKEIKLKF